MRYILENMEPKDALRYFEDISRIPRGSGNEKAVSDYIISFANNLGLEAYQDDVYNVYIKKPGSKGYEGSSPVLLQGHLDMVCEKNSDVVHDFEKDPIKLRLVGDRLYADNTTLGADNGAAVAYVMAILSRKDINHPPLEVLLTVGEETEMVGASNIKKEHISAKMMINLDSGPEGKLLASCAGGLRTRVIRKTHPVAIQGTVLSISVRGLMGGHSGEDIDRERGNANKILGRILHNLMENNIFNIISVSGGAKDNAIPRESMCEIACEEKQVNNIISTVKSLENDLKKELEHSDSGLSIIATRSCSNKDTMFTIEDTTSIVNLLYLIPNGVRTKSTIIDGLVVSSTNLGVVTTYDDRVVFTSAARSSIDSLKYEISRETRVIAGLNCADFEEGGSYPGWPYEENSRLRQICLNVYNDMYNKDMIVYAIHAGVECGLIKRTFPDMDMVSMGPDIYGCHTPKEFLDIPSFRRTLDYLVEVLKSLK